MITTHVQNSRELAPYYIPASDDDQKAMMKEVGITEMAHLFSHIQRDIKFAQTPWEERSFEYEELAKHMEGVANKNRICPSFIGDGLKSYKVPKVCQDIAHIRGLTTAYTPYQPERSQGTLMSLWLYSSALCELTGLEVINASLYDRSTCLFEAMMAAKKTQGRGETAVICEPLFPGDRQVLTTLCQETSVKLIFVPHHDQTGLCDQDALKEILSHNDDVFAVAYAQVNALGLLEDVDALSNLITEQNKQSIAIIDPILIGPGGLKPPCEFGSTGGPDFMVAEGQHLCLGPNFGGPGLGIFGMRYPGRKKTAIRNAPGRLIGNAKDKKGRTCKAIVLSTREQHIRREKATSNICSNQSFVATLAGAALLAQGSEGLKEVVSTSRNNAEEMATELTKYPGVSLAFPSTPFCNEFVLNLGRDCHDVIQAARCDGLHVGVDVSSRFQGRPNHFLMIFCNDVQTQKDRQKVYAFFSKLFGPPSTTSSSLAPIPPHQLRTRPLNLPRYCQKDLLSYYQKLGEQNISPDDAVYPLGSCTMKYNPHLNDYAASLCGITDLHPQAPLEDCQGTLEVLFEIQQAFKAITGLPAVTTQPVAGAQGELVGLKMFQAYHQDRGEVRDVVLIPRSAHGTNPATASMAGFKNIVLVDANDDGLVNFGHLEQLCHQHRHRLCGIMMTNPNTSGVFEERFKEMADLVHDAGGLVYLDGANMNAMAGWVNLEKMGVDAVHNNLHKTWTIPHGGGGPGDAIVAVSEKLSPYLPGITVTHSLGLYGLVRPCKSIGMFHRHFGNFAHKVRALTYLKRLGGEGVRQMSAMATLSSRYLYHRLKGTYATLPVESTRPVMHEFILTLTPQEFSTLEATGLAKSQIIPSIGKLFLDYGLHAPTVAFPERFGLMVEPTESFTKKELDRFVEVAKSIKDLIFQHPGVLQTAPHFTPVDRVDEVTANRVLEFSEKLTALPEVLPNRLPPSHLAAMGVNEIAQQIIDASRAQ